MPKQEEEPIPVDYYANKVRNRKRRIKVYGTLFALLVGIYLYQPQEFDFFPKPAPNPNPHVDPDSKKLFSAGTKIAIITAHPDDSEFYLGGILTQLAKSGADLHQIICTNGDKSYYLFVNGDENKRTRQAEAKQAAATWKAKEVVFLGFPDGRLRNNDDVQRRIKEELLRIQPEYVFCFDGDYPPRIGHQDHRRSGLATQAIIKGIPSVKWLLQFSTHAGNYFRDITNDWDAQKALLAIHKSQFYGTKLERVENMIASNAEKDGDQIETPLGEGFRATKIH